MYPEEIVKPMRQQLVDAGFQELKSADQVDTILNEKGTTLVMVNSVCGCAAGTARPGTILSIQGDKKPDHLTTVFAGNDVEAVNKAREHMVPFPPSSPAVALFKDGELVHMLERHHIEGRSAEMIAENLAGAYQEFC
ncbi:BrxA/BrxB family bacilliredoxin [Aureibaculum conchae]|uniref:BrxA/BrxB family bacilliredoxin n=1 Tax=Aureibaculum sp. 2308TA14-22 TaxID=3108392 RepID=UPI003399E096